MALNQLRTEAATGEDNALAILDSYSKLLQRLADEMDRLPVSRNNRCQDRHGCAYAPNGSKEIPRTIRATLGYWTEHKSDDSVVLNRLFRPPSLPGRRNCASSTGCVA